MDRREFCSSPAVPRRERLVSGVALAIGMVLLGQLGAAVPAEAASKVCGERSTILKRLKQRHEETPTAIGLSSDGAVLEVLTSPGGGWTILRTYPDRPTCIMAVGEAWQALATAGEQA